MSLFLPLCLVCGDRLVGHALRDREGGLVCLPCGGEHLPAATVALAKAGLFAVLATPKNSKPTTPKPETR